MDDKLRAEWTPDCQGKQDFDADLVQLSTRYWPRGGGFHVFSGGDWQGNETRPEIRPSAKASILLQGDEVVSAKFEADTEAEVKSQVEAWAAQQFRIVALAVRTLAQPPRAEAEAPAPAEGGDDERVLVSRRLLRQTARFIEPGMTKSECCELSNALIDLANDSPLATPSAAEALDVGELEVDDTGATAFLTDEARELPHGLYRLNVALATPPMVEAGRGVEVTEEMVERYCEASFCDISWPHDYTPTAQAYNRAVVRRNLTAALSGKAGKVAAPQAEAGEWPCNETDRGALRSAAQPAAQGGGGAKVTRDMVASAYVLCPLGLAHMDRMRWMADYITAALVPQRKEGE